MEKKHICYKEGELGAMAQQLKDLKDGQDRIEKNQTSQFKELKDMLGNLDTKYASKLVEKIVYGLCGFILLAVTGAIIYLVIK
jgi:hypothetical protein